MDGREATQNAFQVYNQHSGDSSVELMFAWQEQVQINVGDVFYREESWGGRGVFPFRVGDYVVDPALHHMIDPFRVGDYVVRAHVHAIPEMFMRKVYKPRL